MTITLTDEELFWLAHGRVTDELARRVRAVAPQLRLTKETDVLEYVYADGRVVDARTT